VPRCGQRCARYRHLLGWCRCCSELRIREIVLQVPKELNLTKLKRRSKSTTGISEPDGLVHRGRSVIRLPIEDRQELVADVFRKVEYPVILSTPFDVKTAELIRAAKKLKFEGVVRSARSRNEQLCQSEKLAKTLGQFSDKHVVS
jgi:hypothetical protein